MRFWLISWIGAGLGIMIALLDQAALAQQLSLRHTALGKWTRVS